MVQVSKTHGQKTVLRDISLGFFYGAKIGVLGLNGAGKSTLLRIMAGTEESSNGEVVRAPGYTVGMLEQEPELEAGKTVLEIVSGGRRRGHGPARRVRRARRSLLRTHGRRRDAEGPRSPGRGPGQDRGHGRLGARLAARARHGRAALPAARHRGRCPLRWRAPPGRALPVADPTARHPPPRRAHQPPRRALGGLARAPPQGLPGHRHRGDPRPLLPRQRRRLDPRARPRPRDPVEGQLLVVARAEGRAAPAAGTQRGQETEDPRARARVDPDGAARPPRQGQGAGQRLPGAAVAGAGDPGARSRDLHPARPAARRRGHRGRGARPRATATGCSSTI